MKKYAYILSLLIATMAIGQQPFINGLDKKTGTPNEIVTISGSNFSSPTVYFGNGKVTTIVSSTADLIQARVPATATYGPVTVVNGNGLSATSSQLFTMAFDDDSELASWTNLPAPAAAISTGLAFTYDLCLCDFDGDDLLDAVVTNSESNSFSVLTNTTATPSSPSFSLSTRAEDDSNTSHNVECADFNGDNKPDLVFTSNGSGEPFIHVYENTSTAGNITFVKRHRLLLPVIGMNQRIPKRVRISDFNGDGKKDIAVGSFSDNDNQLFIFRNTSVGTVSFNTSEDAVTVTGISRSSSLYPGDFDNDGRMDLVVHPVGVTEPVSILRNTSSGGSISFEHGGVIGNASDRRNIVVADFNNDGFDDVASTTSGGADILENDGTITNGSFDFTVRSSLTTAGTAWGIDAGDMNGDGWVDIVFSSLSGSLVYHENTTSAIGATIGFSSGVLESGTGIVRNNRIGDLNDDGRPDIAFVDNSVTGGQIGNFRYLINNLQMTPVIVPISGVYCTAQEFLLRATEGHNLTYTWSVSGEATPAETSNTLDLQSYTGAKSVTVIAEMADGTNSNPSSAASILHDATSITTPQIQSGSTTLDVCVQESVTLTSTGTSGTNHYWYGPNGLISGCTTGTCLVSSSAEAVHSGEYYLIIDSGNGTCQSPESNRVLVTVSGPPIINIEEQDCNDGSITLGAPDYSGSFNYQWKLNGGTNIGSPGDASIQVSTPGDYTLEISDGSCTRVSNSINIPVGPTSSFELSGLSGNLICLQATSTGSGGTLAYTWTISAPSGADQTFTTPNLEFDMGATTGTVTIDLETTYSDAIGCALDNNSYDIATELQPFPFVVTDLMANTVTDDIPGTSAFDKCPGDTLRLSFTEFGSEITALSWDSLDSTTPIVSSTLDVVATGNYVANYTTNTGCETAVVFEVSNYPDLQLTASDPDGVFTPTFIDGEVQLGDGQLSVTLTTDLTVTNQSWVITEGDATTTDNGTSFIITPSTPQVTVQVTGTTSDGCTETETVLIIGGTFLARKSFSPNGDGTNDCWGIINSSTLDGCKVYILDSRGKNILVQDLPGQIPEDPDCIWDGTSNGTQVPEGIYYFVMKCSDGSRNQTGSILLAR